MELIKTKNKEREFLELIAESFRPSNSLDRLSNSNKRSLTEMVSYLSKLKKDHLISHDQFAELITLTCANYIENEVELRISKSVSKRLLSFLDNI